jgi:hypothetical protein
MEERSRKIWAQNDQTFWLRSFGVSHKILPNEVFTLEVDPLGNMYLSRVADSFAFDYKVYDLEENLIQRVKRTFAEVPGNLGILMNGTRGTGKTVTAKVMCNELNLPVIIVGKYIEGGADYLNSIPQDITIFIDEYEKIFEENHTLLSIMDGAMNSEHKRVFILTTNSLYINENLIQRPGRIRYLKTFKDLSTTAIMEIVNDCLVRKEYTDDIIRFISLLEMITVDIVKTICQEVNVHNQKPDSFADVFNVRKISEKFDIFLIDENTGVQTSAMPIFTAVKVRPHCEFEEGYSFYINSEYIGEIIDILGDRIIKVKIDSEGLNHYQAQLLGVDLELAKKKRIRRPRGSAAANKASEEKASERDPVVVNQDIIIMISDSEAVHRNFRTSLVF